MKRQSWPVHVQIFDDELLSTWLVRVALEQGCDPLVATSNMWSKWRAWTRDLDRLIDSEKILILAECTNIAPDRLAGASVWHLVKLMSSKVTPDSTNWPWLLPLGSRNRNHRGGLQFCPECLKGDPQPYFRRIWRMAWLVACPIHGCLLLDRCEMCRRPVEPQKVRALDGAIDRCPHCRGLYSASSSRQADSDVLALQAMCLDAMSSGEGAIGSEIYSSQRWFEIIRKLVIQRESVMLATSKTSLGRQISGLAFELKDLDERMLRVRHASHALRMGTEHPALVSVLRECSPKIARPRKDVSSQRVVPQRKEGPASEALARARWARLLRRLGLPVE